MKRSTGVFRIPLIEENSNDNPADDHRKICRQTGSVVEFPEQSKVIVAQSGKDVDAKCVSIVNAQLNVSLRSRVIDDMQNETEKTIDKIFPSPVFSFQTTGQ